MLVHVLRCAHTKLVSIVKHLRLCSIDVGYMSMHLRTLLTLLSHKLIWKYHLNIESPIFVSLHGNSLTIPYLRLLFGKN
jgi:hypothetical protein